MKYLILGTALLAAACTHKAEVEVTHHAEFKCGNKIVQAEFLDDESMILRIDGINNVLTRASFSDGKRFENMATLVTFTQQDSNYYLSIAGHNYPVCQEINR